MTNKYCVIVNLDDLCYMQRGMPTQLSNADRFETIKEAREELKTYDEDFNGAIYEVTEVITRGLKKVGEENE